MAARIVIPPRAIGAGACETEPGRYLACVETAVYVNAAGTSVQLSTNVFYAAEPTENAQQVRTALEARVRQAFGAPANTPVTWMNL